MRSYVSQRMSQILSFELPQQSLDTKSIREFPHALNDRYRVTTISDDCYEILSIAGDVAVYQLSDTEASLEGSIDDDLYAQFASLCKQHHVPLLLEGEPVSENEPATQDIGLIGITVFVFTFLLSAVVLFFSLVILPFRLLFFLKKK